MNALLKFAMTIFPLSVFGAEQPQQQSYSNSAEFSENRQKCNLITAVISYVPNWRDNHVAIDRAHRNVEEVLIKISADDSDKLLWHKAVDQLYGSKITAREMEAQFRPMCEKIPQGKNGNPTLSAPYRTKDEQAKYCIMLSGVYAIAAMRRDIGESPQEAWTNALRNSESWKPVTDQERKDVVNRVYFDPSLAGVSSEVMRNAVFERCVHPPKAFTPLK